MSGLWDVVAAGRLRDSASLLQRGGEQEARRELHRMDMNGDALLLLAVRSGNPDLVQLLLDHGSPPDAHNRKTGRSALHEAVRLPSRGVDAMRTLEALVEAGAYVNSRDKAGQTPLHVATELVFEDAIDYLLSVGGNPSLKDRKGRKPVHIAKANTESAHVFETYFNFDFKKQQERKQKGKRKGGVRRRKDPNQRVFKAILLGRLKDLDNMLKLGEKGGVRVNSTSHRGHSPLYLASKLGNLEAVKLLIKYGAKPNIMNTFGTTALHAAAEGGHDAVIEMLLQHKAPIDVRDSDKKTPLDLAFQKGRSSTIRLLLNLLLSRGQTFSQKRWDWMFRKAAKSGQVELMQLVMKCSKSLNVNTQTLTGWAPLHIAVRNGHVDAVAFLLSQRGIKTNLGTEANWTPLHVACDYPNADRRMKLMSLLLAQKGTNPNIQNSAGFTPLHMCAKKHDLEGVRLLLEYGAQPDLKDKKGWTPLSIAYSEKQQKAKLSVDDNDEAGSLVVESEDMDDEEEVMHCLIEAGANPNQLSFTSRTSPLFEACRNGMERRAEVLIENGADVNFVLPARMMKRDKSSGVEELYGEERTQNEEMRQAWSVLSVSVLKERSPRIISLLVEKGADVNFTNAAGYTPLHTAVTLANYEVVKILLDAGADPNLCNANGTSPLSTAFCVAFADKADQSTVSVVAQAWDKDSASDVVTRRSQAEKIIEELLKAGALVSNYTQLLKTALYGNSTAVLNSLLAPRPGPDGNDAPLVGMEALVAGSSELLTYLLNMRKRKNTRVEELKELLTFFIDGRRSDSPGSHGGAGLLTSGDLTMSCQLDVNMVSKGGRTPVHDLVLASVFGVAKAGAADRALPLAMLDFERELIAFLVSKGAQLNRPDENTGFTPLMSAVLALDQVKDNREPMYRDRMLQLIDDLLSLGAVPSLTMPDKHKCTWLHHAARACGLAALEKLLAMATKYIGAAAVKDLIAAQDAKGRSALHMALIAADFPKISCLLKHGADASLCDNRGWSPLQIVYMNKNSSEEQLWTVMSELIAHGADMHAVSSKYTILDLAAMNGKWMLAEKLIGLGATFSSNFAKLRANSRQRWPLLHTVAKSGNIEVAKRILEAKGADIDGMDRHMWTAVHIAVLQGDVNMTRLLLEHGADPSQNTNHAWSVLHTAAAIRRAKTLEDLVEQRQEKLKRDLRDRKVGPRKLRKVAKGTVPERVPRPRLTRQEFEEAERKRKEEKAQRLAADEKADVSAQTNEEVSEQMLKLLLENPASKALLNVNGKDERGRTAMDIALLVGNLKGATVLAAHGGRTHKFGFPDGKGRNDLHRAVFDGETRTVKDILRILYAPDFSKVIDVNAPDAGGLTPLMIGSMKPNARIVSELLEHGADPAIIDKSQRNCLHHALLRKRRAVVKVIMKYVGDDIVMARNKDGFTCLELASTQAFKKMSLHDLVSRSYKKVAVEQRPENQRDDREKKVKHGRDRIVDHDVAAWGGHKSGKAVELDLHEDWRDWQDEYEREQEEYEAEEAAYEDYGDGDNEDDADLGYFYRQPSHGAHMGDFLPATVYPYPIHVPEESLTRLHDYLGIAPVSDPSFTYPPGWSHDGSEQLQQGQEVYPGWEGFDPAGDCIDSSTTGVPNWSYTDDGASSSSSSSSTWAAPAGTPSICPYCGSVWPDYEALAAHTAAAHDYESLGATDDDHSAFD